MMDRQKGKKKAFLPGILVRIICQDIRLISWYRFLLAVNGFFFSLCLLSILKCFQL